MIAVHPRQSSIPLTLIIPVYGRAEGLKRALTSVAAQQVFPDEIIIVDDGSTPPAILPETNIPLPVRIVRHTQNRGPAAARNTGMKAARTKWVSFLDSDDQLIPDTLHLRFAAAEKSGSENERIVSGCGWIDIRPDGTEISSRIPRGATSVEAFASGCWFAPGSCVIMNRRELLESDVWQDEAIRRFEDLDWFLALAQKGWSLNVAPIEGALIERSRVQNPDANRIVAEMLREKWKTRDLPISAWNRLNAYLDLECAAANHFSGRYLQSIAFLTRSLVRVPRLSLQLSPGWA